MSEAIKDCTKWSIAEKLSLKALNLTKTKTGSPGGAELELFVTK